MSTTHKHKHTYFQAMKRQVSNVTTPPTMRERARASGGVCMGCAPLIGLLRIT